MSHVGYISIPLSIVFAERKSFRVERLLFSALSLPAMLKGTAFHTFASALYSKLGEVDGFGCAFFLTKRNGSVTLNFKSASSF
ncbi:hypothetical protein CEXT_486911 [Caerostris extrusa]|uniref:Uncharacterized protein n=1 Tax=Caerostris extrusa TaxID=172846 RepID=A0AAV4UPB9_CAEEX|nr:hypothetical protein CEXT_486911 [Caerostris extrusa]